MSPPIQRQHSPQKLVTQWKNKDLIVFILFINNLKRDCNFYKTFGGHYHFLIFHVDVVFPINNETILLPKYQPKRGGDLG